MEIRRKKSAMIVIGDEVLSGHTQDKNVRTTALWLVEKGIVLQEVRIVNDKEDAIIEATQGLSRRYDYVFTSGGIGPTHDDVTAASVASAFGVPLGRNDRAYGALAEFYGEENLNPGRLKMADMPKGALLIDNAVSGAPGFQLGNVFVMAGVPAIYASMLSTLGERVSSQPRKIQRIVRISRLPESVLAGDLRAIVEAFPDVSFGSYPRTEPEIEVRVVITGDVKKNVEKAIAAVIAMAQRHGEKSEILA